MSYYLLKGPFITLRGERRLPLESLEGAAAEIVINPMCDVLQGAIYACATPELAGTATAWSADRPAERVPGSARGAGPLDASGPCYLTGKHTICRIFDEDPALAPLAGTGDVLATRTDWPAVYSPECLITSEIPIAAVVYEGDMFAPREFSLTTTQAVRNTRAWITNEYQHDDFRASFRRVFAHLLELLHD